MSENIQAEEPRLFELDDSDRPTPEAQVTAFMEEHAELFEHIAVVWTKAIEADQEATSLFGETPDQLSAKNSPEIEFSAKKEGWRVYQTFMLDGHNQTELTSLSDRLAYARAVTERYRIEATGIMANRLYVGTRIGTRTIRTQEDLEVENQSANTRAITSCAYATAFFTQAEAKWCLAQLAEDPQTAEALLDRIKKEAEGAKDPATLGFLQVVATDIADKPKNSTVHTALTTKYNTPQRRSRVLCEWLTGEQLPRRLRQETAAALQVMRLITEDIHTGSDDDIPVVDRFAQRFEHWPAPLQADYKDTIRGPEAAEFKEFAKLLNQHVRRSRLPDTRPFRKK